MCMKSLHMISHAARMKSQVTKSFMKSIDRADPTRTRPATARHLAPDRQRATAEPGPRPTLSRHTIRHWTRAPTASKDIFKVKLQDPDRVSAFVNMEDRTPTRRLGAAKLILPMGAEKKGLLGRKVAMVAAPLRMSAESPRGRRLCGGSRRCRPKRRSRG